MQTQLLNSIGELNPQLFREIKGRLKPRNVLIGSLVSVVFQAFTFLFYLSALPADPPYDKDYTPPNRYCTDYLTSKYSNFLCVKDAQGTWEINWQLWWLDIYVALSVVAIFGLLVVGTYLLINDLAKEESKGTLNFIRLSPQSSTSILWGKILGVPSLLYLVIALAIPMHLIAGFKAHISFDLLLGFGLVLGTSCVFFYSLALLYGLVSRSLGLFQSSLASGSLFIALTFFHNVTIVGYDLPFKDLGDWLRLFYPGTLFPYLFDSTNMGDKVITFGQLKTITGLNWYNLPLWQNSFVGISLMVLNYFLFTFWVWQGLKRRFHNPTATVLSKGESYWFSTTTMAIICGFAVQSYIPGQLYQNLTQLMFLQLLLFLVLIAVLSPHRQTLIDWVSYRHLQNRRDRNLWNDLIWGEKSPSSVAIAINLVICAIVISPGILLLPLAEYKTTVLLTVLFNSSVILIYGIVAQLVLLLKRNKGAFFAVITVGTAMITPFLLSVVISQLFNLRGNDYTLFLFSSLSFLGIKDATTSAILFSLFGQVLMTTLGGMVMLRKLKAIGESASKKAFAAR